MYRGKDMTNQQRSFHLSIASTSEIERTARQLRAVREGFLTTGSLSRYALRSMILESWQRCYTLHVNPARRCAPLAVARETQLDHLRQANALLMRAARPAMDRLSNFLCDSGYVIVLSDAQGRLLEVTGDATIRRRLARIDFIPGGNWSEAAAGTNAIGTALTDGHVVQLMAAEHYCDGWQDLTCTAAPIRHPSTDEIIGILDVTGNYRLIRPFLTNSLATAALEIQQQMQTLLTATSREEQQRIFQRDIVGLPKKHTSETNMNNNSQRLSTDEEVSGTPSVDDMRLWLDLQQRSRVYDAERLAEATGAISASLDLDTALEKVAEQVAHLLQLESAAVFLFDEAGDIMSLRTWSREDSSWSEPFRDLESLLGQAEAISFVRERGEPVFIDDVLSSTLLPAGLLAQLGIHSMALLPLVTAHGVIGFIAAPRRMPYHWVLDDVRLGLAFAAPAATAIEYARLCIILQQHNSHTEVLNTMAELLNTLPDPNQHLELVLKQITEIMNLDAGMILLLDPNVGGLTIVAHYGLPRYVPINLHELPLRQLHEVACLVVATGESLQVDGPGGDERSLHKPLRAAGFFDLMAVPLVASSTTLGVLLVGSHTPRGLTEDDLALFTTIGQQLGLTLKNAQLLRSASEMEALREADRLKSGFLATVSHDLRSPLTAIRASIESLLDCKVSHSDREQEHVLNNIADQASRLGRMVDQLLDLSRIEAGALSLDRDWTELSVLITDTVAKFEGLNGGYHVEQDVSADLPLHYVDPDRLVQVLWNLLENASKYASSSSPIKLEAKWTGTEVLIKVADRGPGIPAEEQEKIFQHFYRLDRDRRIHTPGSGLGLAICQGIVQAHGGSIWVEDRPGGGSIFCVSLPLPPDTIPLEGLEEQELYPVSIKEK